MIWCDRDQLIETVFTAPSSRERIRRSLEIATNSITIAITNRSDRIFIFLHAFMPLRLWITDFKIACFYCSLPTIKRTNLRHLCVENDVYKISILTYTPIHAKVSNLFLPISWFKLNLSLRKLVMCQLGKPIISLITSCGASKGRNHRLITI